MIFNVLEKVVPFVVLPIVARYLSKDDMGIYIIYQTIIALILPFVSMNTDSSILLNFYKLKKDQFKIYFYNALIVFFISLCIIVVLVISFPSFISQYIEFPKEWLVAVLLISVYTYFIRLTLNLWQVEQKPKKYGIFSLSLTILKGGLLLLFVVWLKKGWDGLIISQIVAYTLMFIISIYILIRRKTVKAKISKPYIIDALRVGGPLTLHQVGGWLSSQSNRIIINILIGTAATGSFGIGATYGTMISVIQNAFNRAFKPYLFDNLLNLTSDVKVKLVKITYLYNFGLLVFSLFIGTLGYLLNDYIFGSQYADSKVFIIWMVLGNAFNGLYKMHVNYIFYTKRTHLILYITLTLGLMNVGLSYWLIGLYGAIAGAQVFFITQSFSYILAWYIGNRLIPLPWFNLRKF